MEYDLAYLASFLNGKLNGDSGYKINSISSLDQAQPDQISYCSEKKYSKQLETTRAGAVVISQEYVSSFNGNSIVVDNPHLSFVKIARLLHPENSFEAAVHPSAIVSSNATVSPTAWIGPNVVIEDGANIGDKAYVGAGCYVGQNTKVGDGSKLYPGVTVQHESIVGSQCVLYAGVVIGSDGFGFARDGEVWEKIPQVGRAVVGDDVEIGANTTIDRGAIHDTVIHSGVKIDNLVHIAHNVEIGENTIIAACTGIAGSAKLGKRCSIGGSARIFGHIEIADDVVIAANSLVGRSIKEPGVYSSAIRAEKLDKWQKNIARFGELDSIARRLRMIEKEMKKK